MEEGKEIEVTRRSLLSVSQQISEEWTPLFFSTTSLVMSGWRAKNKDQDDSSEDPKAAIARLTKDLLAIIPVRKLRYVRKLVYHHHRPCPRSGKIKNDDGLIYLADILGHVKSNLPHLTSVTFVAQWTWDSFVPFKYGANDDHDGAFAFVDDKGRLEELAQRMLRDRRGAILRGWSVEKKAYFTRAYQGLFWMVKGLELTFRNTAAGLPQTIDEWVQLGQTLASQP